MFFQIPQFTERETRIYGPITMRHFLHIGVAGVILFFLYVFMAEKNPLAFTVIALIVSIGTLSLAFITVNGRPLSVVLMNIFGFTVAPKIYLWRRKMASPIMVKRVMEVKADEPKPVLKMSEKSQLQRLSTKIETGL